MYYAEVVLTLISVTLNSLFSVGDNNLKIDTFKCLVNHLLR